MREPRRKLTTFMLETAADPDLRRFVVRTLQRIAPNVPVSSLDAAVPLRDQVDLDSIDWLNFVHALEDGLGIGIPPSDYGVLSSVDALSAYLSKRRGARIARIEQHAAVGMHRVADGRTVTIRPIRPDDAERVAHFLDAASAESRYRRFHQWVTSPSATLVHFLTDIDLDRCQAFVCSAAADAAEAIVGEARCVATGKPGVCELGILIEDDWQHSGIAGLLMEAVIQAARQHGYRTMEGLVLAQNAPMLRFARALGFDLVRVPDDPRTVRIVLDLGAGRSASGRSP
jgi:acetyltransferase